MKLTELQRQFLSDVDAQRECSTNMLVALGYDRPWRIAAPLIRRGLLNSSTYANGKHVHVTEAGRALLQEQSS